MKIKKNKDSTQRSTDNKDDKEADSLQKQKYDLKERIKELENLISKVENSFDVTVFGDVTNTESFLESTRFGELADKPVNLNDLFSKELYNYAGLYCPKINKSEYIFNFATFSRRFSTETFSVQLINKDGKVSLGNWVMPMSVDMKNILSETPIDTLSAIISFVRNCKRHVDSYSVRKNQYYELKENISELTNCEIGSNHGFTQIVLQLLGVYHKVKDIFLNLTLYLSYKSNEAFPRSINVDWSLDKDLTDVQIKEIKSYAKCFKMNSLLEGLKRIVDTTHPIYAWTRDIYIDSPLNLSVRTNNVLLWEPSHLKNVFRKYFLIYDCIITKNLTFKAHKVHIKYYTQPSC